MKKTMATERTTGDADLDHIDKGDATGDDNRKGDNDGRLQYNNQHDDGTQCGEDEWRQRTTG